MTCASMDADIKRRLGRSAPPRNGRPKYEVLCGMTHEVTGFARKGWLRPAPEPRTSNHAMKPVPRQVLRARKPSIWFELARGAAHSLPGVEERATVGGPAFWMGRKLLARLDEDGVSLVIFIGADEREMLMAAEPRTFSGATGQGGHPMMRVHLAYVAEGSLRRILEQSWRERAPKRLQRSGGASCRWKPRSSAKEA